VPCKRSDALGRAHIVGCDKAAFARRQRLGGADAECFRAAIAADRTITRTGAKRVGRIRHERRAEAIRCGSQFRHGRRRASQVDGEDRARAGRRGRAYRRHVEQAPLVDVGNYRHHAGPQHRLPGGEKRVAGKNHLAARAADGMQARDQTRRSARHGDQVGRAGPGCERGLEPLHERAAAQPPALENGSRIREEAVGIGHIGPVE
jgi:hypothetical protein